MHGRVKLKRWMQLNAQSYAAFGKEIDVSGTTVYRWVSGRHRPCWEILKRIHKKTNGFIRPDDWLAEDNPGVVPSGGKEAA